MEGLKEAAAADLVLAFRRESGELGLSIDAAGEAPASIRGAAGIRRRLDQHYIEPLVRPLGMPRRVELIAGVSVVVWNIIVSGLVLWMNLPPR